MPPAAVRTLRLHIHEPRNRRLRRTRIKRFDQRVPPKPEAEEREGVVDGGAGAHRDRLGAAYLEVQRSGRDALEVRRVREESEHLPPGPSDELLLLEEVLHHLENVREARRVTRSRVQCCYRLEASCVRTKE